MGIYLQTKTWKEYLTEFLMLFFAVTLGFFAENLREMQIDKVKEIGYLKNIHESGFSALPGGYRADNGSFGSIRGRALFWSDSWSDIIGAWGRILYNNDGSMGRFSSGIKQNGYSLRCLRD